MSDDKKKKKDGKSFLAKLFSAGARSYKKDPSKPLKVRGTVIKPKKKKEEEKSSY